MILSDQMVSEILINEIFYLNCLSKRESLIVEMIINHREPSQGKPPGFLLCSLKNLEILGKYGDILGSINSAGSTSLLGQEARQHPLGSLSTLSCPSTAATCP